MGKYYNEPIFWGEGFFEEDPHPNRLLPKAAKRRESLAQRASAGGLEFVSVAAPKGRNVEALPPLRGLFVK